MNNLICATVLAIVMAMTGMSLTACGGRVEDGPETVSVDPATSAPDRCGAVDDPGHVYTASEVGCACGDHNRPGAALQCSRTGVIGCVGYEVEDVPADRWPTAYASLACGVK